jgi:flagellar hook-length control protein FliK
MSGIQLESLATSPAFDPAALIVRSEPRRDESFEEHLRRAEKTPRKDESYGRPAEPSPARKAEESASASTDDSRPRRPVQETSGEPSETPRENDAAQPPLTKKPPAEKEEATGKDESVAVTVEIKPVLVAALDLEVPAEQASALAALAETPAETDAAVKAAAKVLLNRVANDPTIATDEAVVTENSEPETLNLDNLLTEDVAASAETEAVEKDPSERKVPLPSHETSAGSHAKIAEAGQTQATLDSEAVASSAAVAAPEQVESTTARRERRTGPQTLNEQTGPTVPAAGADQETSATSTLPLTLETGGNERRGNSEAKSAAVPEIAPVATASETAGAPHGRLPPHLLARGSEQTQAGKPLSEADQARFVQRVARAFQTAASQDGELRLRLSPPELGSLRLEVKVLGGVMSARIEAETQTARTLLLENLPVLRERLAEQNIRIEQFDIDLMNRQGSGLQNGTPQDQGRETGGFADAAARFSLTDEPAEEPSVPRAVRPTGNGQLNVLV